MCQRSRNCALVGHDFGSNLVKRFMVLYRVERDFGSTSVMTYRIKLIGRDLGSNPVMVYMVQN
jgi:hypothetical protein